MDSKMFTRRSHNGNQRPSSISLMARSDYGNFFTKSGTEDEKCKETETTSPATQPDDDVVSRDSLYQEGKTANDCQNGNENQNQIEKQLNNALQKPVDMGPGHSMLQRMGWTGGGLGRTGDGIVEPIAPNASYATKTKGLGQTNVPKVKQRHAPKKKSKETFKTNVLLSLLDFVKNDAKIELEFDKRLTQKERKIIHNLVEEVMDCDHLVSINYDSNVQLDIVREIITFNDYVLHTESKGEFPERKLVIYKEAPENMYLVTPDDLRDTDDDSKIYREQTSKDQNHTQESTNTIINIANNSTTDENASENAIGNEIEPKGTQDKDTSNDKQMEHPNGACNKSATESDILNTIIDFFTDFASEDVFTELRFLGTFDKTEYGALVDFFKLFGSNEQSEVGDKMADILNDEKYEYNLQDNFNGSTVIYKLIKDGRRLL
ncbi:uncharacterized protein LOC119836446 isoform X2 [Zerene cesonia]|uniref:uncharacterized protein LOC119836446 isoform X2 n=1 Tax=Zerene cesonia TaxID=33412 RepID=UPI0018E58A69|nr:uncharacterized protein LOC119836446 isoform X2 [Zerene cesonia]